MVLSGQLSQANTENAIFVGELSLEGNLKPVRGIVNIVESAREQGFETVFIPHDNLTSASLIPKIKIIGVKTLSELFLHLKGQKLIAATKHHHAALPKHPQTTIDDIYGQPIAKRALEIAVAGHHNLLLNGSPGTGKTMLAKAATSLLPPLTPLESISVTKLYELSTPHNIITNPPFRAPHHTASSASIVGGGVKVLPGEISLAHLGILFLDELPEFPRNILEALRQPLEDKIVTISRSYQKITYPADFMLIAAMNPCPCGYLNDPSHPCTCSNSQIDHYRRKLSGPLLDRIDLHLYVKRTETKTILKKNGSLKYDEYKTAILKAIKTQNSRGCRNSNLSLNQIKTLCKISTSAHSLLSHASEKLNLSARGYLKTLRVAQTIADLEGSPEIREGHISEALSFRPQL